MCMLSSAQKLPVARWCVFGSTTGAGSPDRWLKGRKACSVSAKLHTDLMRCIKLKIVEDRQLFALDRSLVDAAWIRWPLEIHAKFPDG
jgi:hypothetical protein